MRTVISGGTLVSADGAAPMDVLVVDDKVAALARWFLGTFPELARWSRARG